MSLGTNSDISRISRYTNFCVLTIKETNGGVNIKRKCTTARNMLRHLFKEIVSILDVGNYYCTRYTRTRAHGYIIIPVHNS